MLKTGFQEKHYYLTVKTAFSNKDKIIDCGPTEKDVFYQLELLNDSALKSKNTKIKGFFFYENKQIITCTFVPDQNKEEIIAIKKGDNLILKR